MSYLQINSSILQARFPHVHKKIVGIQLESEYLKPEEEFQEAFEQDVNWLKAIESLMGECKIVFVYGFERGLSIADLLELYPDRWLFVYEPNEKLFYKALQDYDLSPLLKHPNLYFFSLGNSQLTMLFHMVCSYMQQEMVFIALRRYLEANDQQLEDLRKQFDDYRMSFYANKHTENFFREDWTRNYLYHLVEGLSSPSIEELVYVCKDVTAIVVSSGPSLQEDMSWIKRLRPHALIIAVGSSIQALVKNGIKPHIAVIMDGHPVNNKIFSTSETLDSPLVYTSSSYYEISERKQDEKIYSIMKNDELSQYFLGLSQSDVLMTPAATVAGNGIQVAAILGAKRILLAGQDLSFPNNQFYADGISHFASETTNEKVQKAKKTVLNVNGGYNTTEEGFLFMKDAIEGLIASLPEIDFVNTTRHGAVIEGAPFQSIDSLYEELKLLNVDSDTISKWLKKNNRLLNIEKANWLKNRLEEHINDLTQVSLEIRLLEKVLGEICVLARKKPFKAQKMVEEIEKTWGEIANREWFSAIFETILPLPIARFDQVLPNIVTEHSITKKTDLIYMHLGNLLKDISSTIPIVKEMLTETVLRINKILSDSRKI
ncbi:motility associated factor glycosyltransferase family protein [Paenibacillus sp. WLX2291]|uniref:motility associated factor glycosyltransferase family protein n=1 Tax=Paenibacillus sp. WLX2291 TaxID=3296934 RepID=UPI003984313A